MKKIFAVILISLFFFSYSEGFALARAGGGGGARSFSGAGSYGSRGTRTYNPPVRENNPAPGQTSNFQRQVQPPVTQPPQPVQSGGGFFRSLAGGILGGFIGGMLFRSLGYGGFGFGGLFGGIGFFEIALVAFIIFMIYRLISSRRQGETPVYGYPRTGGEGGYQGTQTYYGASGSAESVPSYTREDDVSIGLERIRQFDPSFGEATFKETATDIFFKVQSAWKNRDIESSSELFSPEIRDLMLSDIAKMKREGRVNRLENIAMRGVAITEAWQEEGKDYITVKITANVLDYVTDESDRLIEGSRTEPVKFVEYWTFVRTIGKGGWRLSAIQQDEG